MNGKGVVAGVRVGAPKTPRSGIITVVKSFADLLIFLRSIKKSGGKEQLGIDSVNYRGILNFNVTLMIIFLGIISLYLIYASYPRSIRVCFRFCCLRETRSTS